CVELANRFLWNVYGDQPIFGTYLNGWNFASTVHSDYAVPLDSNGVAGEPYEPGDIVSFTGNTNTPVAGEGHVAIVMASTENTQGNGSVTLFQQNSPYGATQTLTVSNWSLIMPSGAWVTPYQFDAFTPPSGTNALTNGEFVSFGGNVYEMAGGAPLYVHSWSVFGGPQPVQNLDQAQWNQIANAVPANGTILRSAQNGGIFIVAGGAPMYVSTCAPFNNCAGFVNIDQWNFDNIGNPLDRLSSTPANGTILRSAQNGGIFIVAGGAPMYVSTCAPFNNCAGFVNIDQWNFDNIGNPLDRLSSTPANGTILRSAQNGGIFIVAGGAPMYVSTCAPFNNCAGFVNIDQWNFDNIGNPLDRLTEFPANRTFITNVADGDVYEVAGGAPLYISASDANKVPGYDNGASVVRISPWEFSNYQHLRPYPVDGTILCNVDDGNCYVTAGGAPLYISASYAAAIPGWSAGDAVVTSGWEFANFQHLRQYPVASTLLQGVPNGQLYRVNPAGVAVHVPGSSVRAVRVDELTLQNAGMPAPWHNLLSSEPTVPFKSIHRTTYAASVAVGWSIPMEASAVSAVEGRYRLIARGRSSRWYYPPAWQGHYRTRVLYHHLRLHTTVCIEVRVADRAGLSSRWLGPACWTRVVRSGRRTGAIRSERQKAGTPAHALRRPLMGVV
ncbi:MAG: CHAP domain-containing protein, partial [Actinomycetota bacterium]|nr:CHAP domain-containing protein [Actinomycetota bacterium]